MTDGKGAKLRYIIRPGWMVSQHDGQSHYITPQELVRLYEVDPRECVIVRPDHKIPREYMSLHILAPRYDGKYRKPI